MMPQETGVSPRVFRRNYCPGTRRASPATLRRGLRREGAAVDSARWRSRVFALPGVVRVVDLDRLRQLCGIGAEILRIDDAFVVDDERHDARATVLRRGCDEREATEHGVAHHVVERAAAAVRS